MRRASLLFALPLLVGGLLAGAFALRAEAEPVTVYKSPTCGCCDKWIAHLEAGGFEVEGVDVRDLAPVKMRHGIAPRLAACHTALVAGYFVEGHVPAADVRRLLAERPPVAGLAVPGMPAGSPGMEGPPPEAYDVLAVDRAGGVSVFSSHGP